MFVAGIEAAPMDDEGGRILDRIEEAHGFINQWPGSVTRLYQFTQFEDHASAIAWLQAEAVAIAADAPDHVQFGVPD